MDVQFNLCAMPLITGKHGASDHFKICCGQAGSGGGQLAPRRVAFPDYDGLASIHLHWNQKILDMARAELARYAQHYGQRVALWLSVPAHSVLDGGLIDLASLYITNPHHPLLQDSTPAHVRELTRRLRATYGTCHPAQSRAYMSASVLRVVLEAQDPDATLSQLRANATAARIYTRHSLDGITEGEGRAARHDMARMLAALYCGCDYRITPEVT
jgi:hypothetical protein